MEKPSVVMVVDDDASVRNSTKALLEAEGYGVRTAADGLDALSQLEGTDVDLLVVDVTMPVMDGLGFCRVFRATGSRTPILLLTARSAVEDCVAGLDAGADDYLTKPFDAQVLTARLRALARRLPPVSGPPAGLRLDESAYTLERGMQVISLSRTEFAIISVLAENHGTALSRAQIGDAVWGYDLGPASNTIEVYISSLRQKLEADGSARIIKTIRGVGYMLSEK